MAASFRPDIQGLRALAVGGVVAYHFGLSALPGGFAGVDIFFVISGWLITTHLMGEITETGRLDLWRFYARRARRLLPAALFVILVTLGLGYFILAPQEQALYSRGAMKKLLLVSVIAIASAAAMIAPAAARSHVFIGIGGYDNSYGNDYYDGYGDYGGGRYVYSPYDPYDDGYRPRYFHRHHRCHIEVINHWRHHHRIVEEVRVCG